MSIPAAMRLEVAHGKLAKPVLERAVPLFAGRAGLPLERLSDIVLALDALHSHALALSADGRLGLDVSVGLGSAVITVRPVDAAAALPLISEGELPSAGAVLAAVADEADVLEAGDGTAAIRLAFTSSPQRP